MIRRAFLALAAAAAVAPLALAQQPYTELSPPLTTDAAAGKIEVVEFFWYECGHCYTLEPELEVWVKKLPKDVEFRRVPATFSERWNVSARIFYTFEAMGLMEKLHKPLFDAIHRDRLRVADGPNLNRQFLDWLGRQGVDATKFQQTYGSFTIESRMKRTMQTVAASKIDGVPALMVNGRYLIAAGGAIGSHQQMIEVADALIERSRKAAQAAAPAAPAAGKSAAKK